VAAKGPDFRFSTARRSAFGAAHLVPGMSVLGPAVPLLIAIRAVQIVGEVKAGDRVLVHAGASNTGIMSIQVARALGARVAATVRKESFAELAKSLGAELVIDSNKDDFVAALAKWTEGRAPVRFLPRADSALESRRQQFRRSLGLWTVELPLLDHVHRLRCRQ
jgi:hypothetical protein